MVTFKSARKFLVAAFSPLLLLSLSTASAFAQCTLNGASNPCVLNGPVNIASGYSAGNNTATTANGTLNNTSTMTFTSGANNTIMNMNANTTLTGGGTVTLSETGGGGVLFQQSVGGVTLDNMNNTIQGAGVIGNGGLTFSNEGIVNANSSGQVLFLNGSGGATNSGTMGASAGGILDIQSNTNNAGGNITASGTGIVNIQAAITGGKLNSTGGGTLQTIANGVATLNSVIISAGSTYTTGNNTDLFVSGTLTNNGNLNVSAAANNTILGLNTNTTLTGGGTLTLTQTGGGAPIIQQEAGNLTLTNHDNTIQGAGTIGNGGLAVLNEAAGVINANVFGQTLFLDGSGGVTNQGLLEGTNGGTLQFLGTTVNNAGGNITANGGTVAVNSSIINGGTLNSINGGTLQTAANGVATLNGVTLSTGSTYTSGNNTDLLVSGTITNNGAFQINSAANNTILGLNNNTTLTGGGTLTLTQSGGGAPIIQQEAGNLTLTNHDNTIQGAGTIGNGGLAVLNEAAGVINANVSGQTLFLDGSGGVTNQGLLEGTNGGTLQFLSTTVNNAGGNITANGGTVAVNSSIINGGTLNSINGGTLQTAANGVATLNGVTLSTGSTYTSGNNTDLFVSGTITNNGTFQINSAANNTILGLNTNTTLTGGGTLMLTQSGAGAPIIQQEAGNLTLTNHDNTIQGAGTIGNGGLAVLNEAAGVINANVSGQTLFLDGSGGITNKGLLEATNSGTLELLSTTVNNAGGNISGLGGGTVVLNSATIQGGTLNGTFQTVANGVGTLDGSTNGAVTLSSGATYTSGNNTDLFAFGTVNNNGNIKIAAGANNSLLGLSNNLTLNGPGTLTLSQSAGGAAIIQQEAGGLTLTNNSTIQGAGIIGNGGLTIVNGTNGTILANAPGQTLTINGSGSVTNNGTMQVNPGSTLSMASNTPFTNFSGNTLTGGTYVVNGALGQNGIMQLNLGNNLGGEIVNNAANIVLNGPTANTFFQDSNGNNALTNLAANATAQSSFTVEGGYTFQTIGDFSNAGTVHIGPGGSSLTIGAGGVDTYTQSGGGLTLIDAGGTLTADTVQENGGLIQVDGSLAPAMVDVFAGATLDGTGLIVGNVDNAGNVFLGDKPNPGTLHETGNYTQESGGTFMEAISTSANGQLALIGNANLDGILDISLLGNPSLTNGELFTLITFTGVESGVFSSIIGADAGAWTVLYNPPNDAGTVDLEFTGGGSAVPEPSLLLLDIALALGLVLGYRLFRRKERAQ